MRAYKIATVIISLGCLSTIKAQNTTPDSLYNAAHDLYRQAKYGQAAVLFEEAGKGYLNETDSLKWADAILRQGDALMNRGQVQKGRDLFLFVNKHQPKHADVTLKTSIHRNLGRVYRELEQYEQSKDYYLKGIEFARASEDSVLIASLNNNISYAYLYSGDYERAFSHQKKAKEIYESTGEVYRLSFVLNGMFATLRDLGLYTLANKYIRQSLAIRERIGNPNLMDIAYHNMAVSYNDLGKPDSSIIYYQKSLELSRELGNPYDITQTLIEIGKLYQKSGNIENALAYFNEALQINRETSRPVSIAKNLLLIAEVATQQGDLDNAESFYQEALGFLQNTETPRELGNLYLELAELEIMKGNLEQAQSFLSKVENIAKDHNFRSHTVKTQYLQGKIKLVEGDLYASLNNYRSAYNLSNSQSISGQITAASNLAKAYQKVGSDSAFIFAEEAFALIDSIRTNVAGLSFRSGFFRDHARFYNEVASWYITQTNDAVKAFELIEAAKARVLMDELAQKQERKYNQLDEATLIKKQQKAKQIDLLYNELDQAESVSERSAIRNKLKDLEFEYQTFINELHSSSSSLQKFTYPSPISARQAQALLDSETAFLEYAFTDDKLVRILMTKNRISGTVLDSVQTKKVAEFFTEEIKLFREHITSGGSVAEIKQAGDKLYHTLIPNFRQLKVGEISNLVIINDGPITFLPFEALSNNGRYLIEDYNIKYLPSASIFQYISDPHRATSTELLALAGSGFDSGDGLMNTARSQTALASLPSTLLEVDSIAVNFNSSKVLKNEDVTEAALKSYNLGDFRFIHFATHATANEVTPSQSGIILSKKASVESLFGEDGHLNSREISDLQLNADLVTLSACNTGMGKVVTGEGLLGLQRSFLAAGASSVVVSLWSIFDRSTSEFMSSFYQNMLSLQEESYGYWEKTLDWFGMYQHPVFDYKTEALRETKLAMINHPYYNHPVHWAPFILIGK